MAYPFLSVSIYLTLDTSLRDAFGKWFLVGWLCAFILCSFLSLSPDIIFADQVILGIVLGAVLGKLLR